MRRLFGICLVLIAFSIASVAASAAVRVDIYRSSQTMKVTIDGSVKYTWPVSTGSSDRMTRAGSFGVQGLDRHHRSSIYGNAPMPYSIFYDGNRAIHGTTEVGSLGSRASHGCVRLKPSNAAKLFALAQQHTMRIIVH